jgi:hypothetical protein
MRRAIVASVVVAILLITSATSVVGVPDPLPSRTISGTITGPDGTTGLPHVGIGVFPTALPFGPGVFPAVKVTTGSDGSFTFPGLTAAMYAIWLDPAQTNQAGGYSPYAPGLYGSSPYGRNYAPDSSAALLVDLTNGDQTVNISLPLAVHLRGTVTDSAHVPLAGIPVSTWPAPGFHGAVGMSTTALDGSFTIDTLAPVAQRLLLCDPARFNPASWTLVAGFAGCGYYDASSATGFTADSVSASLVPLAAADTLLDRTYVLPTVVLPFGRQPLSLSAATAVGALSGGPFSNSTKIVQAGQSITIQLQLSPAIAGARLSIWIARKSATGTWSSFRAYTSRITNGAGVVRYTYRSTSSGQLAMRAYSAGDATHLAAWSPSRQVRWR